MMPKCNQWGYKDKGVFKWRSNLYYVILKSHFPTLPIRPFCVFLFGFRHFLGVYMSNVSSISIAFYPDRNTYRDSICAIVESFNDPKMSASSKRCTTKAFFEWQL